MFVHPNILTASSQIVRHNRDDRCWLLLSTCLVHAQNEYARPVRNPVFFNVQIGRTESGLLASSQFLSINGPLLQELFSLQLYHSLFSGDLSTHR